VGGGEIKILKQTAIPRGTQQNGRV